jgi:hypothetical protein
LFVLPWALLSWIYIIDFQSMIATRSGYNPETYLEGANRGKDMGLMPD